MPRSQSFLSFILSAALTEPYIDVKQVSDVMRFPSMLAAPPDRIRGWAALLAGFGIATEPALFGKMLKRAPFMFYVNPPGLGDDDLSHVVDCDVSATASGFVAYAALNVLQLLKAQNFPDLDKIVRTQPSILLVDPKEVKSRAEFLLNMFVENMPSIADAASKNVDISIGDNGLESELTNTITITRAGQQNDLRSASKIMKRSKSIIATSQVVFATQEIDQKTSLATGTFGSAYESNYDEVSESETDLNLHAAHDMLGALLLTYPAVLSINHA